MVLGYHLDGNRSQVILQNYVRIDSEYVTELTE